MSVKFDAAKTIEDLLSLTKRFEEIHRRVVNFVIEPQLAKSEPRPLKELQEEIERYDDQLVTASLMLADLAEGIELASKNALVKQAALQLRTYETDLIDKIHRLPSTLGVTHAIEVVFYSLRKLPDSPARTLIALKDRVKELEKRESDLTFSQKLSLASVDFRVQEQCQKYEKEISACTEGDKLEEVTDIPRPPLREVDFAYTSMQTQLISINHKLHDVKDVLASERNAVLSPMLKELPSPAKETITHAIWVQAGKPALDDYGLLHPAEDVKRLDGILHNAFLETFSKEQNHKLREAQFRERLRTGS